MGVADQPDPALVVRIEEVAEAPWANGGGWTREIHRQTRDGRLVWRLSLATIQAPGPFSALPGLRRHLLLASGDVLRLSIDGSPTTLHRTDSIAFDGAAKVDVLATSDGCRALNLMTGGHLDGRLEVRHPAGTAELSDRDAAAIVVLSGRLHAGHRPLDPFDTLVLGRRRVRVTSEAATVALVLLGEHHVPHPTPTPWSNRS